MAYGDLPSTPALLKRIYNASTQWPSCRHWDSGTQMAKSPPTR